VTPYQAPEYHPAFEEYCETIFELREDDVDVIQARIADRLEVSRPAVSEMIRRMETQGLVDIDSGAIRLTDDGTTLAESVVRRHRLAERFRCDAARHPTSAVSQATRRLRRPFRCLRVATSRRLKTVHRGQVR
jgi:Mn-dependent DtxR family transcriptional regulator